MLARDDGGAEHQRSVGFLFDQVPTVFGTPDLAEAHPAALVEFKDRLAHTRHCIPP